MNLQRLVYADSKIIIRGEGGHLMIDGLSTKGYSSKMCEVIPGTLLGPRTLYRTFSNYIFTGETRCTGCLCTCSGLFKRIKPSRTTHRRDNKVCRVLSHEFGEVRLYQTFYYIFTVETRCAGCLCTSSIKKTTPSAVRVLGIAQYQ